MNPRFAHLGDDLRLVLGGDGRADIAWTDDHGDGRVAGLDNLVQALTLRLLVQRGELAQLAHPRYGSRLHESIGVRMTRANLDLLRRHTRRAILADSRVEAIEVLTVEPLAAHPGAVQIVATIRARGGAQATLDLALDLG
jgi:phage baseplate assembly protein W